jgi:hypothetical protein
MSDPILWFNQSPAVTEQDVLTYLSMKEAEPHDLLLAVTPVVQFWQEGDLARFRALEAWWPHNPPKHLPKPALGAMLLAQVRPAAWAVTSFQEELHNQWQRCVAWVIEEKGNPANPNEAPEDRKRRLGAAAVKRHRAIAKATEVGDPRALEVKALWSAYIAACSARKEAAAVHDEAVNTAKEAWMLAKRNLQQT